MQHLEAGVKELRSHVLRFFLNTMNVVEETVASSNGVSSGDNMIREGVGDLLESASLVRSIVIFNIFCFFH